jgi:peptidyl-prolyl cis-trans isomerase D
MEVPQPMVEAIYRLRNEERTISYLVVDETAIEPAGMPGEAVLQAYFEKNKVRFRAPEYRQLALLTLDPAALADPSAISEEEVKTEYERRKSNLQQPERRRVEQIAFDSAGAANEALAAIDGGEEFSAVAESHGAAVTDLGLKSKAEFLDPAVADAAFAAEPDQPVAVIEGALQPSVIRVTEVEPGSAPSLSDLEPRIRQDLATRAARGAANDRYDQVEDERAGGATLEEAAGKLSLPYRVIEAVAADAATPDGGRISDIPNQPQVLNEAFETDIGIENSPIRADDAWVFFEVTDVTPARDRALDEVRAEALTAWTEAETEARIAARAESLLERLQGGAALSTLAAEVGKTVGTAEGVKRGATPQGLTANAVNQAFAGPEGHVADAEGAGASHILLKVDRVVVPAFFAETADAEEIKRQLSAALQNDVVATFNQQIGNSRAISINNAVYQQLTGQLSGQAPLQ